MSAALAIAGEFTIFTARELHERLLAALADVASDIEVDLSGVTEIDSAGLQLMIAAKREAAAQGKALHFTGHSPAVVELLDFCDLAGYFGDPLLLPQTPGDTP